MWPTSDRIETFLTEAVAPWRCATYLRTTADGEEVASMPVESDPLRLALDRLHIPPDQACFIGDTASDIRAGRAAGVPVYGAAWGYQDAAALAAAGADGLFAEPADVVGLVLGERSVTVG
ncbi:HAD hydrolase-like protein [Actinoplanes hulinensis]|uniref:HAD hydrolase-like protein n=1 Tax=Actinoplanes hulinensis TaxID=1144547 RepID=A0ABS7AXS7_9ACTN|nr:HAD hydrolase-like protein [Actinoplanes hulinensis]